MHNLQVPKYILYTVFAVSRDIYTNSIMRV